MSAHSLTALAQRVAQADPRDAQAQKTILDDLVEVYRTIDRSTYPQASECIDGAMLLITYLAQMGGVGGEQVGSVIVRLLNGAAEVLLDGSTQDEAAPAPAGTSNGVRAIGDMLLGEILLRRKQILPTHLDKALRFQQRENVQFGEALVRLGIVTQAQVEDALRYQDSCRGLVQSIGQQRRESSDPKRKETLRLKSDLGRDSDLRLLSDVVLGEVMVRNRLVTREALEEALRVQRATGLRIGEALVSSRACTWQDVEKGLELQKGSKRHAS